MPLDLSRVQGVFQLVIEQTDPAARRRVLEEQCAGKPQLRARVELLLRAHDQPRELPAAAPAAAAPPRMHHAGMVVAGRYKLLELLGEGGMGAVWVAEQSDPIRRRVALKLIKPGMDSKQVLSRFEAERQALALMEHPNIAKVFDGGMTDEGRPYFAMEYVKGVPITDYCDQAKLSVTERMKLFIPVCQAVQHAHQKGVIHRDLKPTNILVCLYDGLPIPKVIDFGLAKAISQRLTENTLYTAHGLMVGTPMYMSPEQAEFNNLDVDTRTDIYSLGVILYELLTGTTPLEKHRFQDAAFAEILRIIKEDEPPRPSTKVSASATLPTLAAQRSVDPAQLSRQVRGELDWIVMKSLEKERSRRYETANGMARDLERFLNDEPVEACPPSLGYRFRKALRRNKKWFSAGIATIIVLLTITGAVGWNMGDRWSRQAKAEARAHDFLAEARSAAETGDLQAVEQAVTQAESSLATVYPNQEFNDEIRQWKGDLELVRQLEQADRQLAKMVFDEETQRKAWATLYAPIFKQSGFDPAKLKRQDAVGWLKETPLRRGLASAVDTWAMHSNADERDRLLDIVREADPPAWRNRLRDALVRDDVAALRQLASDKDLAGQPPRLLVLLESALSKLGERDVAIEVLREALQTHPMEYWLNLHLGQLLLESRGEQAVVPARAALAAVPQSAAAHNLLGGIYCLSLKPEEAEPEFREGIRLQPDYALAHMNLAFALGEQKKYKEALASCEQALKMQPHDAYIHLQRANLLYLQDKFGEAKEAWREALRLAPDDWLVNGNVLAQFKLRSTRYFFVQECEDALKLAEADPRWRRWMAEVLLALDRPQASEEAYREFLREKPNDPLAEMGLVSLLMKQNRASDLDAIYEGMRHSHPDGLGTNLCHAAISLLRNRMADAEKSLQRVLQKEPYLFCDVEPILAKIRQSDVPQSTLAARLASNEGVPLYRAGRWLWMTPGPGRFEVPKDISLTGHPKTGTPEEALSAKEILDRNPNLAKANVNYGWAMYHQKEHALAEALIAKAIDLDPQYVDTYVLLGWVRRARNQYEAAERSFRQVLTLDPLNPGAHQGLALVCRNLGRYEEAAANSKKAVELRRPEDANYYNELAKNLARLGKWEEAADAFRKEMALRSDVATSHNDYGWVLQRLGRVAEAEKEFAEVRRLAPKLTHSGLGSDYAHVGRFWEAAQHYLADFKGDLARGVVNVNSGPRAAMMQLLDGDRAGYEATCKEMLERLSKTTNPGIARDLLCAGTLGNPPVGTPEQLRTLAEHALEKDHPERVARQLAMLAVRNSNWEETLKQCRTSRTLDNEISKSPVLRSQVLILEALAYHHLQRPAEAKAAYYEAARQISRVCPYAPYEPGTRWFDWALYELPRREAAALLGLPDEPWDRQAAHRGYLAVCQGEWKRAAAELQIFCRDPRADSFHWMRVPTLLMLCGDTEGYRQQCEEMRLRFAASETWEDRERVSKICVMLPGFDSSVLPINEFTEALENGNAPEQYFNWGYASWAMIGYRTGDFERAIAAAKKVLLDPQAHVLPACQSHFVTALASHKLGRADEAEQYGQQARKKLETSLIPLQPDGSVDIAKVAKNGNWWDAVYLEVLRKEAAELLEGK